MIISLPRGGGGSGWGHIPPPLAGEGRKGAVRVATMTGE